MQTSTQYEYRCEKCSRRFRKDDLLEHSNCPSCDTPSAPYCKIVRHRGEFQGEQMTSYHTYPIREGDKVLMAGIFTADYIYQADL